MSAEQAYACKNSSPLGLTCKNCGAPIVFDIASQSYRCSYCGSKRSAEEFRPKSPPGRSGIAPPAPSRRSSIRASN